MTPIYLNHLLCFVNLDTYESIGASKFLNQQFACSEERTTFDQRTGMSWTGRYYYGHSTYFEFMTPTMTSWNPRDGLAFTDSYAHSPSVFRLECRQSAYFYFIFENFRITKTWIPL